MSGTSDDQRDGGAIRPGAGGPDGNRPGADPTSDPSSVQGEPSQQEQHNPDTEEDTASGGAPESPEVPD